MVCARRQWRRALGEYYMHFTHLIDPANPGFPERCLGYAAILENGNYTSQMTALIRADGDMQRLDNSRNSRMTAD